MDQPALLAATLLALASACTPALYAPPARTIPLETPAPLGTGRTAVQGSLGVSGAVFDTSGTHATARVAHGVTERTEVNAELTTFVVTNRTVDGVTSDAWPGLLALRVGGKYSATRHFALTYGVGTGGSAAGGFVSPDIGFVTGFDNPRLVPFFSFRLFMSRPFRERSVTFDDNGELVSLLPERSRGWAWAAGLRKPVGARLPNRRRRAALSLALGGTVAYFDGGPAVWFGIEGGLEIQLDARPVPKYPTGATS